MAHFLIEKLNLMRKSCVVCKEEKRERETSSILILNTD